MSLTKLLIIWPGFPVLSMLFWISATVVLLYLARTPAHRAIYSSSRVIHAGLRLASRSVLLAEEKLAQRNKEVLLNGGMESVERAIEREFHRVDAVVKRDLSGYPTLHRALLEQATRIDEDYRESYESPPPPPEWVNAVEAVANIPSQGDGTVVSILTELHKAAVFQYKASMEEYREAVVTRHALLHKMMPYCRRLTENLAQVGKTITGLHERAGTIENRMAEYEAMRGQSEKAARILAASSFTQFLISNIVLLIAAGGIVINFNLIALPMSEMVGGGSYIGDFKTSNVAALAIILMEMAMGLYLMEALRITRLFPIIGQMDDRMRTRMVWVSFSILLIIAGAEAALAFMRDQIAADMQALSQSLAAAESTAAAVNSWIPTVGQMVIGFILPLALAFTAIPLEAFIKSSRAVMGMAGAAMLRGFAFLLRLLGNTCRYLGKLLVNVYDLLIFPPLWMENLLKVKRHQHDIMAEDEVLR